MARQKLVWWTLWHSSRQLDIDADQMLHLYRTKDEAERAALGFGPNAKGGYPKAIKIRIHLYA